jgi:cytidylate kinase
MSSAKHQAAEPNPALDAEGRSPRHGDQGDRAASHPHPRLPASLSIAVSREAGSRGNTIGTRAGLKLGWPVYNQEMLDYVAQEPALRQNILDHLPSGAASWVEAQLAELTRKHGAASTSFVFDVARLVLSLGAQGEIVFIGRGAGCILPRRTTLNVRIVAPLDDRIAYIGQWLRLPTQEAAEQVRARDRRRAEFLSSNFHRQPNDVYQYDLVLNSSLLGEDLATDLIVQAARAKIMSLESLTGPLFAAPVEPAC